MNIRAKQRSSIFYLVLFAAFTTNSSKASDCPVGEKGLPGYDIFIQSGQFRVGNANYKSITDALDSFAKAGKKCPIILRTSLESKDSALGSALCNMLEKQGFSTVRLHDPNLIGWTLYPPGVDCTAPGEKNLHESK